MTNEHKCSLLFLTLCALAFRVSVPLPGWVPGQYDPKLVAGFKADPKSGFLTGERFQSEDMEGMCSFRLQHCCTHGSRLRALHPPAFHPSAFPRHA